MAPRFLNVDLNIHSRLRLDAVVGYFVSARAMVLAHGKESPRRSFARIEAAPESAASRRRLSRSSLTLDGSLDTGTASPALHFPLAPSLLRRLQALDVTLALTVCPLSAETSD